MTTKQQERLFKNLKKSGATVEKVPGEKLWGVFGIRYQNDAWKVLEEWENSMGDIDPWVSILFQPSQNILDTMIVPPDELGIPIQRETSSIVYYYSTLRMDNFVNGAIPDIGAPLRAPSANPRIHHATIALSKLMERIQNPPANYPTLLGLKSGSYVCTITQLWADMLVEIVLMKP